MATSTQQIEEKPRVIIPRAGRGNEILAILFIALGLLLTLCLVSAAFYPNDPSWNSAGQSRGHGVSVYWSRSFSVATPSIRGRMATVPYRQYS